MTASADSVRIPATLADRAYGAVAPRVFEFIRLAARVLGTPAGDLRCRAGVLPDVAQPAVWFHGASAGEMAAALRLTTLLRQHGHRFTAAYTATNRAGLDFVARSAGADAVAALAPWDHPSWVARALDQWRPRALVLVETELWPRLILEANRRRIPVLSASARIYPRDLARYRLIRHLTTPMLRRLT
ncbi:MAG TPA: glycosyltransferase N-terminal domain-containing protein, partial [Candidatus Kryptonia bacterium]|nr:glycosyltransferase N-terminal domain-containing protein [Candidatus Kryptonia bacterium]